MCCGMQPLVVGTSGAIKICWYQRGYCCVTYAVVKRLSSLGKDVVKSQRSGLGDEDFVEIAVFQQIFVFCAVLATATAFVSVMYWYAVVFSTDLGKKSLFSLYMVIS